MSAESPVISPSRRASVSAIKDTQGDPISGCSELLESSAAYGSNMEITPRQRRSFLDKSKEGIIARNTYLKIFLSGSFLIILLIFGVFSIFWGTLWKLPAKALSGIIVDFDGGFIGGNLTELVRLQQESGPQKIDWKFISSSQYPGGTPEVGSAILEENAWVAIVVNEAVSARLLAALISPNASYDGTTALTVFGIEGRNENAFRSIIQPTVKELLGGFSMQMALQTAKSITNLGLTPSPAATILITSPQTLIAPVSYQVVNLAPFTPAVATAVTFVGLILQLILAFFVVMVAVGAREASCLNEMLSVQDLIILRFVSSFGAYFVISFCYSLLSAAFQLPLTRRFGHAGFLVFWAINYVGMLALGLALESMVVLLTRKFLPFFMLVWIIANISVSVYPIEVLPAIFKYGYAAPFYNISRAMRTLLFGTKNQLGSDFGILVGWIASSCVTLPLLQIFVHRKAQAKEVAVTSLSTQPKWENDLNTGLKDGLAKSSAA